MRFAIPNSLQSDRFSDLAHRNSLVNTEIKDDGRNETLMIKVQKKDVKYLWVAIS
jgi:hypothetical protein